MKARKWDWMSRLMNRKDNAGASGTVIELFPLIRDNVQRNVYWLQERRAAYHAASSAPGGHIWDMRRQAILHIAKRHNGVIRVSQVASECNVNIGTAALWLHRMLLEGLITIIAWQHNRAIYAVKEVGLEQ
ncbi:hypothetical protein [Bacillus sp. 3255]|uniref:hypothetical protein n=1 Tax=Bacillus sp. 3255 TaxID=2817904 RepID=UPI00285801EE|nr:hypothetical protein [Bacillus sp. 3255]MDR6878719.1 putative transcriptional regulator [Bacillus sp. 3255]